MRKKAALFAVFLALFIVSLVIVGCDAGGGTSEPPVEDKGPWDASKVAVSGLTEEQTAELGTRYIIPVPTVTYSSYPKEVTFAVKDSEGQDVELIARGTRIFVDDVDGYTDTELRSVLANFLFYGEEVEKKVAVLSPGEKARVALSKVLLRRANLLVLDEPTNHFDPETQKVIGENLRDYTGTIVMVSHNPAFVEQVGITRMLEIPTAVMKNYSRELLEYYYYLNSDLV